MGVPMRVLQWIDLWRREVGGPLAAVQSICRALLGRGHEAVVATADPRDFAESWSRETTIPRLVAVRHGVLGSIRGSDLDALSRAIESCDAVQLHGVWERSTAQVASIARRRGVPYFCMPHGALDPWAMSHHALRKRIYLRLVGTRIFRNAAGVVCNAAMEASHARRWIGPVRVQVLPNFVDLDAIPPATPGSKRDSAELVFLGRLHPSKGPDLLIESLALLRHEGLDAHLSIAGPGDPKYVAGLRSLCRRLRVEESVRFLGRVDEGQRAELLRRCTLMALPTVQENFGISIFEALAAGAPVVTTDAIDTREEFLQSGGGVLATRTAADFARAIGALLRDAPRRRAMGEAGAGWVRRWLDPERLAERYEALYRSAASPEARK